MMLTPLLSAELNKTSWFSLELVGEHACKHAALSAHFREGSGNRQGSSFSTGGLEAERVIPCHTGGTGNMGGKKKEHVLQP